MLYFARKPSSFSHRTANRASIFDVRSSLDAHALVGLAARNDKGRRINFQFLKGFNPDGSINKTQKGEAIQAQKIHGLLRCYFPEATFQNVTVAESRNVALLLTDSFELDPHVKAEERFNPDLQKIDMSASKAGTAFGESIDKSPSRAKLGISDSAYVVSFYARTPYDLSQQEAGGRAVMDSFGTKSPDILIFTFGNEYGNDPLKWSQFPLDHFDKVLRLSELEGKLLAGRVLIFNDLIGKMPELYAASDIAVVAGALNFFEPLSYGLPTVILGQKQYLHNYNAGGFRSLVTAALRTGGAVYNVDIAKLGDQIKSIQRPDSSPALAAGSSSLKILLNQLYRVVATQL